MKLLRFIFLNYKKTILPLAAIATIVLFAVYGVYGVAENSNRRQYDLTLRALRRAADECYAIEGQYPPNIDYLCENYRVRVNTEKYFVVYDIFAPGIRPKIILINRG